MFTHKDKIKISALEMDYVPLPVFKYNLKLLLTLTRNVKMQHNLRKNLFIQFDSTI